MSDAGLLEEFRAVRRLKAADYLCGGNPATTG